MVDIYMNTTFTSITKLAKIWVVPKERGSFQKTSIVSKGDYFITLFFLLVGFSAFSLFIRLFIIFTYVIIYLYPPGKRSKDEDCSN